MKKKIKIFLFLLCLCTASFSEGVISYPPKKVDIKLFESASEMDFSRILLIIHYNHPYYQSIPFLREIYSSIFPHIVFYGEQAHPEVNVYPTHFGWFCQNVIMDAMEKWPDFEGYICVQDDCFMNFWNFARLDQNKVWISSMATPIRGQNNYWSWINLNDSRPHIWPWVNLNIGKKAVFNLMNYLEPQHIATLEKSCGPGWIVGGLVDFVYIPGRLRDEFIYLCKESANHPIFVEIAVPFILSCIEDIHNWELLTTIWVEGSHNVYGLYGTHYDWVHPFKFSNLESQKFIKHIINRWRALQLNKKA